MNPTPAVSRKCHGVQAKRLKSYKTMQKPTRNCIGCLPSTCHDKTRKLHGFGGSADTGNRTWDFLNQRAGPHQLSYTCNFPLVLFLFPLRAYYIRKSTKQKSRDCRRKSITIEGNPLPTKRSPLVIIGTTGGNHLLYSKDFLLLFVWRSRGGDILL